eukprot:3627887-Rhodomonas_salina.2
MRVTVPLEQIATCTTICVGRCSVFPSEERVRTGSVGSVSKTPKWDNVVLFHSVSAMRCSSTHHYGRPCSIKPTNCSQAAGVAAAKDPTNSTGSAKSACTVQTAHKTCITRKHPTTISMLDRPVCSAFLVQSAANHFLVGDDDRAQSPLACCPRSRTIASPPLACYASDHSIEKLYLNCPMHLYFTF